LQDEGGTTPLDHIPPFFGKISARYHKNKLDAEVYSIFNAKKSLSDYYLNGEDNEQYAPADGMPGWYTLNLRLGYRLIRFVNIQAGVDNIMDLQYRNFASGINAPGRNVFVALRLMM
jgi:hemoglobin/transferrin/lactoferrin receptor protein